MHLDGKFINDIFISKYFTDFNYILPFGSNDKY
jgi:hypothetical protein